jgi:hypothetical protein
MATVQCASAPGSGPDSCAFSKDAKLSGLAASCFATSTAFEGTSDGDSEHSRSTKVACPTSATACFHLVFSRSIRHTCKRSTTNAMKTRHIGEGESTVFGCSDDSTRDKDWPAASVGRRRRGLTWQEKLTRVARTSSASPLSACINTADVDSQTLKDTKRKPERTNDVPFQAQPM